MNAKKKILLAADFETTVWTDRMKQEKGVSEQTSTEVWSAAYAQLYTDNVCVLHSIKDFMECLFAMNENIICWFHNLRFDGSFIVDFLLRNKWKYNNAKPKDMLSNEFKALISAENRWYSLTLKKGKKVIEFRDSVKLMPFTLAQIANAFQTKHKKLEMEYAGERYAGCEIKQDEMGYIINDVLVLKEALEIMLNEGHDKLTIGSCCMSEYKKLFHSGEFNVIFPNLKNYALQESFKYETADEYIRRSYHGGWCYLKPGMTDKNGRVGAGKTYDVNSLYPSVMHSKSGNYYPIGKPSFFKYEIPDRVWDGAHVVEGFVFFVRFKCCFQLKEGYLPTVQIKRNLLYNPTEWLETSDVKYRGKYYHELQNENGEVETCRPELVMTHIDFELFLTHYNVSEMQILDGCWFYAQTGIFDDYINKYMEIKMNSKGAKRTEAKLFLNNLYGKLATSDDSSYRIPHLDAETNALKMELVEEHEKSVLDISKGSYVTAYARYFTITHAQQNYDAFVYADTDSIHMLDVPAVGIVEHPSALLCWKNETKWSSGYFLRQKTYAEFVRYEDGEKVTPHWEIKCAGMPDSCKRNFLAMHPITDFKYGLRVPGKLMPKLIPGGTLLVEKEYTLRKKY